MKIISRSIYQAFGLVLLASVAFLAQLQAVVPPPDGGYPNLTTAEGQKALFSLTSGAANTAVGWFSLNSVTTGSFNTGVGAGTLVLNTGDENTAIGFAALLLNTATGNTAVGSTALLSNTTGGTLGSIQGSDFGPNVAVGQQALESNTVASANTAVGYQALHSFTTGPMGSEQLGECTAVGFQALANTVTDGYGNSAFGYQALKSNTTGFADTAVGWGALRNNTGSTNTATGDSALISNTTGDNNTATGASALISNTTGDANAANGATALNGNTTGAANTANGYQALFFNTTGSLNSALGAGAGNGVTTADRVICIGANVGGANVSNTTWIASVYGVTTQSGTTAPVIVSNDGQLGTVASSERFKKDIAAMDKASDVILSLRPVTFHYKTDTKGTPQFGLIAEEVAKVNPALVLPDKEGKPYTVRYDAVNAMLLNEFLKEHRRVQEQEATIAQLKKDFRATVVQLTTRLDAQAAQIQKVSAQLELSKPALKTVLNDQ